MRRGITRSDIGVLAVVGYLPQAPYYPPAGSGRTSRRPKSGWTRPSSTTRSRS